MVFESHSEIDTNNIAQKFASKLVGGTEIVFFYGGMGLGKTAFTKGILKYFNSENLVSSPTFAIMNQYDTKKFKIYHFDMYRITSDGDLDSTGFYDYMDKGIILVEWSENIEKYLKNILDSVIKIRLYNGEKYNDRFIDIEFPKIKKFF